MCTLGDTAFYNFEKMTGVQEGWVLGPNCWGRKGKGIIGVYFHVCRYLIRQQRAVNDCHVTMCAVCAVHK
jgi:hypothetical protein